MPNLPHAQGNALVVIVDDDEAVRQSLRFTLEMEGYRVVTCSSGEALLALDLPEDNACLVVDERLPGLSGLAALAELRRRGNRLPAILITSHPRRRLQSEAAASGTPIVEKPIIDATLASSIERALV